MNAFCQALFKLGLSLPRVTEEGQDAETVMESTLVRHIASFAGSEDSARAIVATVRRLFCVLSLLDEESLTRDAWRFVSFPALLCARSVLAGASLDEFRVFEPGFWDPSEYLIDRQRSVLRQLEIQRQNVSADCVAIRRVWVSWALLSCDGKFLMVHREDTREQRVGSRGSFGFPGGRLSPVDLAGLALGDRLAYFDPALPIGKLGESEGFLTKALTRELHEELEFGSEALAATKLAHSPICYTTLEGAKSAHALTEYVIQLFQVELTERGKDSLLRSLAKFPDRYTWFSVEEINAGQNSGGATAFVDALRNEFNGETGRTLGPVQCDVSFSHESPISETFDLPVEPAEFLLVGATGRERAVMLGITASDLATVNFLGAVRRGEPILEFASGVSAVPDLGWVLIDDDQLLDSMKKLAVAVQNAAGFALISVYQRFVRINVTDPALICFSPHLMSISCTDERRGKSYFLRVKRNQIPSTLGRAEAIVKEIRLSEKLGAAIYGLLHGDPGLALDNLDNVKRMQRSELPRFLSAVGARLLIRQVDGVPELSVREPLV